MHGNEVALRQHFIQRDRTGCIRVIVQDFHIEAGDHLFHGTGDSSVSDQAERPSGQVPVCLIAGTVPFSFMDLIMELDDMACQ